MTRFVVFVLAALCLMASCGRAAGRCQGRAWFAEQALAIIDKLADGAHVGVNIVAPAGSAGGFEPWFRFNAERMMTPASNTKLLTIGTAFLNLPHDGVAVTRLSAAASNQLCVACGADPSLTEQNMAELAQAMRVASPAAELVVQPRYPGPEFPPSWMAEDITADYGAHPAQGCLVDEGAFSLTVTPNPQGQGLPPVVRFASAAVAASIKLLNVAVTSPPSGDQPPLSVGYHMGVEALVVAGSIAPGAPAQPFTVAAPLATAFYAQLMHYYLRQSGALAANATISVGRCSPPAASSTFSSAPFLQLWNYTLQNSDNFYAETFARTLGYPDGAAQFGAAAIDLGIANITATLRQHGVGGNWQLWDGSGVSRKNLIEPQTLTDLLLVMYARPDYASSWLPLLPVGCVSGTLSSRFCTPQTKGNVHAKTGTVSGVSALSGYAYTPYSSDPFVFSIIVNNAYYSASQQRQLIDSIVDLLFQVQHC